MARAANPITSRVDASSGVVAEHLLVLVGELDAECSVHVILLSVGTLMGSVDDFIVRH